MKKLLLILACVALATVLFVGCIPGITPTPDPEPEPIMEAVALAELLKVGDDWTIAWSIVNVGDVFIREYTLTFEVEYPDMAVEVKKDYVTIELTKTYLEVGAFEEGEVRLADYGADDEDPESVSVTWELSE
ncbi:hypothetical protein ES708_29446 [subsurface metagenome]